MPLFSGIVTRDVTESVEITVEADTPEKAQDELLSAAKYNSNIKWEKDENEPSKIYLGDPDAVEQVEELSAESKRMSKPYFITNIVGTQAGTLYRRATWKEAVDLAVRFAVVQCDVEEKEIREELENAGDFLDPNREWRVCILQCEDE